MAKYWIAGVQIETGKDTRKNTKKIETYIKKAGENSPDFLIIPEMFEIVAKPADVENYTHKIPCDLTEMLSEYAAKYNMNIIGGSFFEEDDGKVYNTSLIFNRKGAIVGKYRKMHLFDAFGFNESSAITPGEKPLLLDLDGLRFGVGICYDIRFPELFRYYSVNGAQVVFLPAAFFQPNHDHWVLNIRSRALDGTIFVASANQTGKYWVGRSMVADPWGIPVASAGTHEGFYITEIDTDRIQEVRKKLPTLNGRRFDVVLRNSI